MLRDAWIVYLKELREVLRDRKTLFFMLVLPIVLIPALGNFMVSMVRDAQDEAAAEQLRFATFGDALAPALVDSLARDESFVRIEIDAQQDIADAIRTDELDFALVFSQRPDKRLAVAFYFDSGQFSFVQPRVRELIDRSADDRRAARLDELGLTSVTARDAVLEPIVVEEMNLATARAKFGEAMGGMLTYMLILFAFLGGLYPAIDLGAGEKERGTLETLLLSPTSRTQLILGKLAVIFTGAVTAGLLTVVGLGVFVASQGELLKTGALASIGDIHASELAIMGLLIIPTAATLSAILLMISIYAKSFKEAQSYAAPVQVVLIVPLVVAMVPGVKLDFRLATVPFANVALAIKELIKGTLDPTMLVVILASTAVLAGAAVWICVWWFNRESVLFRK